MLLVVQRTRRSLSGHSVRTWRTMGRDHRPPPPHCPGAKFGLNHPNFHRFLPPPRLRTSCSSATTATAATTCTVSPPPCRSRPKVSPVRVSSPPTSQAPSSLSASEMGQNERNSARNISQPCGPASAHGSWGKSWICWATIENGGVRHSGCFRYSSPAPLEKRKSLLPPQNPSLTSLAPRNVSVSASKAERNCSSSSSSSHLVLC